MSEVLMMLIWTGACQHCSVAFVVMFVRQGRIYLRSNEVRCLQVDLKMIFFAMRRRCDVWIDNR